MFKDILYGIDIKIKNNEIPRVEPLFRNSQMLNYPIYAMYYKDPNFLITITINI